MGGVLGIIPTSFDTVIIVWAASLVWDRQSTKRQGVIPDF